MGAKNHGVIMTDCERFGDVAVHKGVDTIVPTANKNLTLNSLVGAAFGGALIILSNSSLQLMHHLQPLASGVWHFPLVWNWPYMLLIISGIEADFPSHLRWSHEIVDS